jgi:hypothetical protein
MIFASKGVADHGGRRLELGERGLGRRSSGSGLTMKSSRIAMSATLRVITAASTRTGGSPRSRSGRTSSERKPHLLVARRDIRPATMRSIAAVKSASVTAFSTDAADDLQRATEIALQRCRVGRTERSRSAPMLAVGKAANLEGERPLPSIARFRTASISDARGGNKPRCART